MPAAWRCLDARRGAAYSFRLGFASANLGRDATNSSVAAPRPRPRPRTLSWHPARTGCFVGEPVFAPRAADGAEDDGWLLVVVCDVARAATGLVVLDARSLTLVAELEVPQLLPLGLNGSWAPA